MIGIIKAMGCYQQHREGTGLRKSIQFLLFVPFQNCWQAPISYLAERLITSEFGKLTPSAHFQIRKIGRSPTPKPAVAEDRPIHFIEASEKTGRNLFSYPTLMIYLCRIEILIHEHMDDYMIIPLRRHISTTKSSMQQARF